MSSFDQQPMVVCVFDLQPDYFVIVCHTVFKTVTCVYLDNVCIAYMYKRQAHLPPQDPRQTLSH